MNLIRLCVERPVGVTVCVLLVMLFGFLSLTLIPVQLTPNVDVPKITVGTMWRGANPQEVEREIVDRQEEQLRGVKGLRKMTSSSSDGGGNIELEFYPGTDKNEALREVADKLNRVQGYPLDMEEPTVAAADTARDSEIAWLLLRSTDGNDEHIAEYRDFANDEIKPYLDRVEGVGSTDIYGGREREVQVRIDAGRLAARGLTFQQVETALRGQNMNMSAGTRPQGKRDYAVRTVGQYESAEEILKTVIAYTPGGPVYVRDVATVERTFAKVSNFVRAKGEYVLAFPVRREVGSNVMRVMAELRQAIERINKEVLRARGLPLELVQVYDETVYISQAIEMVRGNLFYGGLFTLGVLWFFLRSWRATLVVAVSIPISVVATFGVLVLMGRTLNVISLAGLAFAIGTVVDSAVVVLDNIFRHRQEGKSPVQATLDGAHEVWSAVLAGALTAIAVFVPVIMVQDEAGQLFRDISIATMTSVALSVVVAITVVPPLAARILGRKSGAGEKLGQDYVGGIGNFFAALASRVNASNGLRIAALALFIVASFGLSLFLIPPTTYLPSGNQNLIFGIIATPPGYSQEEYRRMARVVEGVIGPYWRASTGSPEKAALDQAWIESVKKLHADHQIPEIEPPPPASESEEHSNGPKRSFWTRGREDLWGFWPMMERARLKREWYTPPPAIEDFFFVAFGNTCFMGADSAEAPRVSLLPRLMNRSAAAIPGVFSMFMQSSIFRFGGGNNLELQVRGDRMDEVKAAAQSLQMGIMGMKLGYPQANPANFALGRPEVRIIPDRERAADLGLTARDVGFVVEACVDGAYVGDYRETDGKIVDLVLLVEGQQQRPTQEIGQVPIFTPSGSVVPLGNAINMIDTTALEQINHIERQRSVTLNVNPPETMALETAMAMISSDLEGVEDLEDRLRAQGQISPRVLLAMTGNADKLVEARNVMIGEWRGFTLASLVNILSSRFMLSVIITYLLMAALFESWLYPFVMMFSVPLAIFGGLLGLSLARAGTLMTTTQPVQQFDALTFLGFVILVGTVVNNGILLVEQYLRNERERGMEPYEAIREAVRVRVRPVFMTSFTNVFGQLPLAVLPGAGSELYRGMAAVLVMGMFVATIGTLVIVPCVLSLIADARTILRSLMGRRPAHSAAVAPIGTVTVSSAPPPPSAAPSQPVAKN